MTTTETRDFVVTPTSGNIGAAVNVDLDDLLGSHALQQRLRDAVHEHIVVVLRQADPTPAQHVGISRIFGEFQPVETYNVAHATQPEITVFDSNGGYKADQWHADATWREDVPSGGVLVMRQCPSVGGDTVFSSAIAAYDSLSDGMKRLLDGRRARHDIGPESSFEHPVVVEHPVTGKSILFVNRIFTRSIVNLPQEESAAILPMLLDRFARPEFTYRHRWQNGDVVIWDNFSAQHYALFDFDERRIVDRVGIIGGPLEAATFA